MGRARNPNSAEIALPVNAFPVQSGLKEKEQKLFSSRKNKRFHFCSDSKNINKHAPQHPSLAETDSD